jgi:hypothetical protein
MDENLDVKAMSLVALIRLGIANTTRLRPTIETARISTYACDFVGVLGCIPFPNVRSAQDSLLLIK